MSSISSVGSNNPYQAQTPVAKTGGVDADGDNDGTRAAAAPAPASNSHTTPQAHRDDGQFGQYLRLTELT